MRKYYQRYSGGPRLGRYRKPDGSAISYDEGKTWEPTYTYYRADRFFQVVIVPRKGRWEERLVRSRIRSFVSFARAEQFAWEAIQVGVPVFIQHRDEPALKVVYQ